jgi:hypothetical protein
VTSAPGGGAPKAGRGIVDAADTRRVRNANWALRDDFILGDLSFNEGCTSSVAGMPCRMVAVTEIEVDYLLALSCQFTDDIFGRI